MEIFNSKFQETIEKHAPMRFSRKNNKKKFRKPWITTGIYNAMVDRDRLLSKARETKSDEDFRLFKQKRNFVDRLVKKSQQEYRATKLRDALNTQKATWQIINDVIGKRKRKKRVINKINDANGRTLTNHKQISDRFNSYFANIGKNMASEIPNRPLEIGTTRMQSSFTLYESSPEEVSFIISK